MIVHTVDVHNVSTIKKLILIVRKILIVFSFQRTIIYKLKNLVYRREYSLKTK